MRQGQADLKRTRPAQGRTVLDIRLARFTFVHLMLKKFRGDLHIHTCLSPCGDLSMLPTAIVREAKRKDMDIIGICDHNSGENVAAVKEAGRREGIAVMGGIEIASQEEVHILALFDDDSHLLSIQNTVYENLPGSNDESVFGEQLVVDEEDRILASNERLLIGATQLVVEKIVETIHRLGGIAIASHVDRDSFSIISQLGFIPEGLDLDALEVSPLSSIEELRTKLPQVSGFPLVAFSDAHYLQDIGTRFTSFFIEEITTEEMKRALLRRDGRRAEV